MKSIILLLCLISFAPFAAHAYKHKSETEIAQMTPAQRVDEYAEERFHHEYDTLDDYFILVDKYIRRDGLKAVPRLVEIINEYDPMRSSSKRRRNDRQFDSAWMLLSSLDRHAVRLRASEEGKRAINALEKVFERLRSVSGKKDQHDYNWSGRFDGVKEEIRNSKGINFRDDWIRETFRIKYEIILTDDELLKFSNFLVASDSNYPSWSGIELVKDSTRINAVGSPMRFLILEKPERYYEAYTEFKKIK